MLICDTPSFKITALNLELMPFPPVTLISGAERYPDPELVTVIESTSALIMVVVVAGSS